MARRVEKFRLEEMTEEQRGIYETITGGPRASMPQIFPMVDEQGLLEGPFNAWLINPVLGQALEVMGSAYRDGMSSLNRRCREISILIIAKRYACDFELYAHIRVARDAKLEEEAISDLVAGREHRFSDASEQVVADTTRVLLERHDLDDAEYARALDALGIQGVFALVWLVAWYAMLAMQLNVLRVPLPDGQHIGD